MLNEVKNIYGFVSLAYGTKDALIAANNVYNKDVPIFELDEKLNLARMKMGNGATPYMQLPYVIQYTLTEEEYNLIKNAGKPGAVAVLTKDGVLDPSILGDTTLSTNDKMYLVSGDAQAAEDFYNSVLTIQSTE